MKTPAYQDIADGIIYMESHTVVVDLEGRNKEWLKMQSCEAIQTDTQQGKFIAVFSDKPSAEYYIGKVNENR